MTLLNEIKDVFSSRFRYHGEAVCSTRHNVVQYQRVPRFYFVLYDLQEESTKKYLSLEELEEEGKRTNLETVATLYRNTDESVSPYVICETLITAITKGEIKSMLGGDVEGVVLKHHSFVDSHGKKVSTKLKWVTEKFQERQTEKKPPPEKLTHEGFLVFLGSQFSTEARYHKAVQHLRERGILTDDLPTNITLLVEELDKDLQEEHTNLFKNYLWVEFSPIIKSHAREGFSQWYKTTFGFDRNKSGSKKSGRKKSIVTPPELPEKETTTDEPEKKTNIDFPVTTTDEPEKETTTDEPEKETELNFPVTAPGEPEKETDINFPVTVPGEPEKEKTVPSQKNYLEEFILKIGSNYATEERFMKAVNKVTEKSKMCKKRKKKSGHGCSYNGIGF